MLELNQQEFQTFKRAFDLFDKDGNGTINKEEIQIVFKELNIKLKEGDLDRIMRQFDQNGDACIEFQEFIHVLSKNVDSTQNQTWLFEVFQIIDQDCDGYISREQLAKAIKLFNLQIDENEVKLIMQACENGDNGISFQQFSSILRFK